MNNNEHVDIDLDNRNTKIFDYLYSNDYVKNFGFYINVVLSFLPIFTIVFLIFYSLMMAYNNKILVAIYCALLAIINILLVIWPEITYRQQAVNDAYNLYNNLYKDKKIRKENEYYKRIYEDEHGNHIMPT